jgi:Kef-type K+ transport system membrane component KefB
VRPAAVRLALLLLVLAGVSALGLLREDQGTPVTFAGGALLLSAIFAGRLAASFGLPRLTGYLVIGIIVGPYALRFISTEAVGGLDLVRGLAVSLIALVAGTELQLGLIRRVGVKVTVMCLGVTLAVFVAVGGALLLLKPVLGFMDGMSWPQAVSVAALVSAVIVSFSPTVTIAIVQETSARGPFTEFLMAFVIIGDLVVLVLFAVLAGVTRAAFGAGFDPTVLLRGVGWELFGSLALGLGLGVAMLVYLRKVRLELPLFITAVCFVSAEAGLQLHLSPLLLALAAGAAIANLDEPQAHKLHDAAQYAGLPVFALFFAVAGADLNLGTLRSVGPLALGMVVLRGFAIWLACRKFAPAGEEPIRRYLWMGLISQAGVTFGLAVLVGRTFPTFGAEVEVLILAVLTISTLTGPILTRRSLQKVGETA